MVGGCIAHEVSGDPSLELAGAGAAWRGIRYYPRPSVPDRIKRTFGEKVAS